MRQIPPLVDEYAHPAAKVILLPITLPLALLLVTLNALSEIADFLWDVVRWNLPSDRRE